MGVPAEYLYPCHTTTVERVGKSNGTHAYKSGEISFLGGGATTEHESEQFIWVVHTYQPRVAVPTTPSGLALGAVFGIMSIFWADRDMGTYWVAYGKWASRNSHR